MFTGIVEEVGTVTAAHARGDVLSLRIAARDVTPGLPRGGSIALSGCCLTAGRCRWCVHSVRVVVDQPTRCVGVLERRRREKRFCSQAGVVWPRFLLYPAFPFLGLKRDTFDSSWNNFFSASLSSFGTTIFRRTK